MYCKLTTYNKMNVCSEGFENPRYVVDLQEITPPRFIKHYNSGHSIYPRATTVARALCRVRTFHIA